MMIDYIPVWAWIIGGLAIWYPLVATPITRLLSRWDPPQEDHQKMGMFLFWLISPVFYPIVAAVLAVAVVIGVPLIIAVYILSGGYYNGFVIFTERDK